MFILVAYKDGPELSDARRRLSEPDLSEERSLPVNPLCPVRVMMEYIRNRCKLAATTRFDLCDSEGTLKGLLDLPAHSYADHLFEPKRTYYLIVFRIESDKRVSVVPQLNRENKLYAELRARVKRGMDSADTDRSPSHNSPATTSAKAPPRKK